MPPAQVLPRPFILGVVLLLLVLSMQSDWNNPSPRIQGNLVKSAPRTGQLKDGVAEKLIYELSLDNERLEQQLKQLKQYVLDVRRAASKCGCDLDDNILTLYPELHFGAKNNSSGSQRDSQAASSVLVQGHAAVADGSSSEESSSGDGSSNSNQNSRAMRDPNKLQQGEGGATRPGDDLGGVGRDESQGGGSRQTEDPTGPVGGLVP